MWSDTNKTKKGEGVDWGLDEDKKDFFGDKKAQNLFAEGTDLFGDSSVPTTHPEREQSDFSSFVVVDPREVRRPETAPMILTLFNTGPATTLLGEEEEDPAQAYRYTPEYHQLYFSQTPRDPRMLPPLSKRGSIALSREEYSYGLHRREMERLAEEARRRGKEAPAREAAPYPYVAYPEGAAPFYEPHAKAAAPQRPPSSLDSPAEQASVTPPNGYQHMYYGYTSKNTYTEPSYVVTAPTGTPPVTPPVKSFPIPSSNKSNEGTRRTPPPTVPVSPMEELRQALKDYLDLGRPGWTYSMLEGKVAELAQEDQDSSRLVQRVMENPNYFYPILEEMLPQFDMLTKHVFANYAIQKAFEVAALASDVAEQRRKDPQAVLKGTGFSAPLTAAVVEVWVKDDPLEKMMQCVRGKVVEYSQHMYGCRAMQRALESMPEKDFDEALNEFRGKAAASVLDANANHVVQKMIELHPEKCQFMLEEFLADLVNLSCHAHGCRLLQRVFEISAKRGELEVRPLLEEVIRRLNELSIHQYGNYVVQHGLANAPADIKHRFIGLLIPQLYAFSCSKFASNVAERAVSCADEEERNSMLEEFKKSFGDATSGNYLILMMADIYANYVIQRFIDNASPDQRDALVEIVRPHLRLVSNSEYGRHLLRKMESMSLLSKEALHQCGVYDTNHTVSIANGHKSQSNGKNNTNNNRRGNTAAPNRGGRQNQPNHPQHHNNNAARYQNPMAPPHKSNSRYNTRSMEPQPYPYPYPMMYPPQPPMVYPMPMYNGYYPQ